MSPTRTIVGGIEFGLDYTLEDFAPFREQTEFEREQLPKLFPIWVQTACRPRSFVRNLHNWGMAPTKNLRARRVANAPGRHTATQLAARVAFYGGLCWICRTAPGETVDHVKPIVKGGSNWPANLRPACRSCNSRKRDQWPFRGWSGEQV